MAMIHSLFYVHGTKLQQRGRFLQRQLEFLQRRLEFIQLSHLY